MEASVSLNLDNSHFSAAIDQAESRARTFSSKLSGLLGGGAARSPWDEFSKGASRNVDAVSASVTNLFRRSREHRAEHILGFAASDLATGNVAGAIEQIAFNLSGVGLAAGVGLGAGILLFQKLEGQINETKTAFDSLSKELSRPLSLQTGLGPEGIGKELESVSKATDELVKKRNTWAGFLVHGFSRGRDDISEKIVSGFERQKELASAQADEELRTVGIKKESLYGDERAAALAKIDLENQKKVNALYLERSLTKPGRSAVDLFKSVAAATQEGRLDKRAAGDKFDLKEREEEVSRRILDIQSSSLDKEHEAVAIIRERIGLRERERAAGVTVQRGSAIDTEIKRLGLEAAGVAREKVAAGGRDVNLTGSEFQADALQDYLKRRSEAATARAELGQLQFETGGKPMDIATKARFDEFQTEAGGVERGNLLDERRTLMRQQGLSQEASGGEPLIGEDAYNYMQRSSRIGQIDKALETSSGKGPNPITKEDLDAFGQKYWGG
jgi:hypothetical protein